MKKIFLLSGIIISMFAAVNLYSAEKNIFKQGIGVEKQILQGMPNNRDFDSDKEFIAYSKAFRQNKNILEFNIPKSTAKRVYRFAGMGPFAANGASIYRLSARITKLRRLDVAYIYVSFFKGKKSLGTQRLLMIPSTQGVAMIGYFLDFATPVQADKIIIWFALSGNGKVVKPGTSAILADIKIVETGKIKLDGSDTKLAGKNLCPVFDFEKEKQGPAPEWKFMKSGHGKSKLKVNIAEDQNGKCLQIKKTGAKQYSWFHFRLPKDDFYYGNLFRLSLRVKGTGIIRLGIWWRKAGQQNYEYRNSEQIKLTNKWQDVQYELYCNDPVTTSAAIAICLDTSSQTNVLTDDIKFMIMP